jgi:Tfp pilus assembly protein PilN
MKDIDFLPEPYREACHRHDLRVTRVWFAVIGLCALGLWFSGEEMRIHHARKRVDYLARQNKTVHAGLELIKSLRTEQAELREKFDVIKELGPKANSVEILAAISKFMPAQIALKEYQLTCKEKEEKTGEWNTRTGKILSKSEADKKPKPKKVPDIKVSLVGLARNEMDVAILVGQLSGYKRFQDIRLEYCKADSLEGHQATQFKITFAIKPRLLAEARKEEG